MTDKEKIKLDIEIDWDIAETQGAIYRTVCERGYDLVDFNEKYLNSAFCNREMDSLYSVFQLADAEECLDFIDKEFEAKKGDMYSPEVAEWVGFIYRFIQRARLTREGKMISSRELLKAIPTKEMIKLFGEYRMFDEEDGLSYVREKYGI